MYAIKFGNRCYLNVLPNITTKMCNKLAWTRMFSKHVARTISASIRKCKFEVVSLFTVPDDRYAMSLVPIASCLVKKIICCV